MDGREAPRGARNPAVVAAARLHRSRDRKETGRTLLEGPHLLEEALAAGVTPDRVFALPDDEPTFRLAAEAGVTVVRVERAAMERLAGTETPRGPVAVIAPLPAVLDDGRDLLVAWGVSEPGNLGSLVRTAAAFGWGFAWTPGTADPWSPKALRAGAGAHFRIPMSPVSGLDDLGRWQTLATVVSGGEDPAAIGAGRWAVLAGEEAAGLPDEVAAACDRRVTVPMPGGTESLNVGVATGIVVYQLTRNRSATL
ncbi:MAG: RNA methyltransferase [Actinomycetes bacterium]|nr:MAG: RNA methyltransferase [Actinomycetota bacterium]